MKVKRIGTTEILRRICLFSANKMKSSEYFSKQPNQLIVELNSSLQHIIVTKLRNPNLRLSKQTWIVEGQRLRIRLVELLALSNYQVL